MAEERLFTIPLRKEFLKAPIYKRTSKAIRAVKEFTLRHMKAEEVRVGPELNTALWARGRTNPPTRIKAKAILREKIAYVTLPDAKFEEPKKAEDNKKTLADKLMGKKEAKKEAAKDSKET